MSFRKKVLSLNRVRDHITIKEGGDELRLTVDRDANTLMHGILAAQKTLGRLQEDNSDEMRREAAQQLSEAIFGEEQAARLLEFYGGDTGCVITICGMYFGDKKYGLAHKIAKAQKRNK